MARSFDINAIKALAKNGRMDALRMVHHANSSHIGSCLSIMDVLAVLYGGVMNVDPDNPDAAARDRFVLSKGHAAAALYAILAHCGFFSTQCLSEYCDDHTFLTGHVNSKVPGVDFSTGSLGHGLPIACGLALAGRNNTSPFRSFALLSDGELDEGSNWEAILFAPQQKLDNLIVIVDYNKIQSFGQVAEVLDLEPLEDKWKAANWSVKSVDGHDVDSLYQLLKTAPYETGKPSVIIAHTTKGKGVDFMEDQLKWHYKSPNQEELKVALEKLKLL